MSRKRESASFGVRIFCAFGWQRSFRAPRDAVVWRFWGRQKAPQPTHAARAKAACGLCRARRRKTSVAKLKTGPQTKKTISGGGKPKTGGAAHLRRKNPRRHDCCGSAIRERLPSPADVVASKWNPFLNGFPVLLSSRLFCPAGCSPRTAALESLFSYAATGGKRFRAGGNGG